MPLVCVRQENIREVGTMPLHSQQFYTMPLAVRMTNGSTWLEVCSAVVSNIKDVCFLVGYLFVFPFVLGFLLISSPVHVYILALSPWN